MQILIGNLPATVTLDDVNALLITQIGAPEPLEVTLNQGMGINTIALVQYAADAPKALGEALVGKLRGLNYKGHDLNATVTHNFKE